MLARRISVVAIAAVALVAALLASLALGAEHIPVRDVVDALTGRLDPGPLRLIIVDLRLPRAIDAILVGAALGVAGALLQGALGNPLASPDVIGVTGGAGFGAVLILLVFPSTIALLPIGALVFGLTAAVLVFGVAYAGASRGGIAKLILSGIGIQAFFFAATSAVMVIYSDRVQSAVFWLAGGLVSEGWTSTEQVWPYFLAGLIAAVGLMRPLDRLALGDDVAASLGARPRLIRLLACITAAVLASAAASLAGLLSFLGLVTPHVVRMAGGTPSNRYVVPVSGLVGAAILLIGDTLSRVVAAPRELPVGPFMVALGVPLFLWLLREARLMLEARDVKVTIGDTDILLGADLTAEAGKLVAVLGPNGAGKSTLARAVAGLQRTVGGTIRWGGDDIDALRGRKLARLRAFIPQRPTVPEGVRVADAVMIGRSPHVGPFQRETAADREAVAEAMERAGVSQWADRLLTTLSGGELQRVQIAIALAQQAPALIADEPTSSLDLGASAGVGRLLRTLADDGLAVILVVHDLALATAIADEVVVIHEGRSVCAGPALEVLDEARLSEVWQIDARLEAGDSGHTALHVAWLREQRRA